MATKSETEALVATMVAKFKLNEDIAADLHDARSFAIEYHKKQTGVLKVTGQRSTGAKFAHIVPWVHDGK
jgi:hypothetical protein